MRTMKSVKAKDASRVISVNVCVCVCVCARAQLKSLATAAAHDKDLNCAALAPNAKMAVSGGGDKVAKVWQMPDLMPKCGTALSVFVYCLVLVSVLSRRSFSFCVCLFCFVYFPLLD